MGNTWVEVGNHLRTGFTRKNSVHHFQVLRPAHRTVPVRAEDHPDSSRLRVTRLSGRGADRNVKLLGIEQGTDKKRDGLNKDGLRQRLYEGGPGATFLVRRSRSPGTRYCDWKPASYLYPVGSPGV